MRANIRGLNERHAQSDSERVTLQLREDYIPLTTGRKQSRRATYGVKESSLINLEVNR